VVVVHEATPSDVTGLGSIFRDHVVVGVDGSPAAREALEFAFAFAADHRRPLVAAMVGAHHENDVWFDDTMMETHLDGDPEAARALQAEVEPWHHKFPEVEIKRALIAGAPVDGLRRIGATAALLVVGTAGDGPAAMGSVSRGLVDRAPCPVAIVKALS
jgi:nucleotide-binding universal stress UspA family protein